MSILYLIFAEDMKAIHNKDYSVVKTLKAGPARASSFFGARCRDGEQPVSPLPAH